MRNGEETPDLPILSTGVTDASIRSFVPHKRPLCAHPAWIWSRETRLGAAT